MTEFPGNEDLQSYVATMNRMREEYPVFATVSNVSSPRVTGWPSLNDKMEMSAHYMP